MKLTYNFRNTLLIQICVKAFTQVFPVKWRERGWHHPKGQTVLQECHGWSHNMIVQVVIRIAWDPTDLVWLPHVCIEVHYKSTATQSGCGSTLPIVRVE